MKQIGLARSFNALLIVIFYSVCTFLAFISYPHPYSPTSNWLSDLGNKVLSPTGAIFYNAGILLTAGCLVLFFLGFSGLKIGKHRIQNLMVLLTQIFGLVACAAMALSALFTIDNPGPHSFFSGILYINLGTAFAFSVAALRYYPQFPRWLLFLGALTTLCDLVSSLFFNTVPVFEWITVFLFLGYVALLGRSMKSLVDRAGDNKSLSRENSHSAAQKPG